jgi:hypothetical protein
VQLWDAIDSQRIATDVLPNDVDELRGEPSVDRWPDLGKVADLIFLSTGTNETALVEIGFEDAIIWPGGGEVAADPTIDGHDCTYRLLARMTREGLFAEAITFNYDCHYEGALIKEGFSERARPLTRRRWPEQLNCDTPPNSQSVIESTAIPSRRATHECPSSWSRIDARNSRAATIAIAR